MNNLSQNSIQVGFIKKWCVNSSNKKDFGFIRSLEEGESNDYYFNKELLDCSREEIEDKIDLLVTFEIEDFQGRNRAINVKPIRLLGYVEWYGGWNSRKQRANEFGFVEIDTNCSISTQLEMLLKNYQKEEFKKLSVYIHKTELLCPEEVLLSQTPVCFHLRKTFKDYEACELSLLENEDNLELLAIATNSSFKKVAVKAFQKYISLSSEADAIDFALEKINDFHHTSVPKNLFSLPSATNLRDYLPINERLKLCFELVQNQPIFAEELLTVAQQATATDWQNIPENFILNQIGYESKLWKAAPDFIKIKVGCNYLKAKSAQEGFNLANNILAELKEQDEKINFVKQMNEAIKFLPEASFLRNLLPIENRISIYQKLIATSQTEQLIKLGLDKEINKALNELDKWNLDDWFTEAIAARVIYQGFLWDVAPEQVKKKILSERFAALLDLIEKFDQYTYASKIREDKYFYDNLDENDIKLIKCWLKSQINNENLQAKMLSARAAEKLAIQFYQALGHQVRDVSLEQLNENNRDWCTHDLLLDQQHAVDIKNARTAMNNKKSYSELTVKTYKTTSNNQDVTIAGVLSPYLQLQHINKPGNFSFNVTDITFLGEINQSNLMEISNFFSKRFDSITMPRNCQEKFLAPWLFDYPRATFYCQQEEVIEQIKSLSQSNFPTQEDCQILGINLLPLFIQAKINLPAEWTSSLPSWQKQFISQLREIPSTRVTLPYLFLSVLSHFLQMLKQDNVDYHPNNYGDLLYTNNKLHPLGIYDPLNIISEFCKTLAILWDNRAQSKINQFKIFKFVGTGILQGKINETTPSITILAYCGGEVQKHVYCKYSPLVLGIHEACSKCGKLICSECGFCLENCGNCTKDEREKRVGNYKLLSQMKKISSPTFTSPTYDDSTDDIPF